MVSRTELAYVGVIACLGLIAWIRCWVLEWNISRLREENNRIREALLELASCAETGDHYQLKAVIIRILAGFEP